VSLSLTSRAKKIGLVTLSALIGYIGAYFLVVEPVPLPFMTGIGPWPKEPHCRVGGKIAEVVFTPAMVIERKANPRRWQFTDEDMDRWLKR
jgi:hypothetical protein